MAASSAKNLSGATAPVAPATPVLEVEGLRMHFPLRQGFFGQPQGWVKAVDGISFTIQPSETLALVGESGCGKSTAGRAILRLYQPTGGSVRLEGREITRLKEAQLKPLRRRMQMIFQDPYASLNPRMRASSLVAEPLAIHGLAKGAQALERAAQLFEQVGLRPDQLGLYPHQFSGGQRQRLAIARALALQPALIVGDEPVSALDVSIQAQVLNLLQEIQAQQKVAYLFISHNLAVVRHLSHRVAVMYLGRLAELAPTPQLFAQPRHPYTQALLESAPQPLPGQKSLHAPLKGDLPSPSAPPTGCAFHTRCPRAVAECAQRLPEWRCVAPGHWVACHLA